jgi:hypothetical protein
MRSAIRIGRAEVKVVAQVLLRAESGNCRAALVSQPWLLLLHAPRFFDCKTDSSHAAGCDLRHDPRNGGRSRDEKARRSEAFVTLFLTL